MRKSFSVRFALRAALALALLGLLRPQAAAATIPPLLDSAAPATAAGQPPAPGLEAAFRAAGYRPEETQAVLDRLSPQQRAALEAEAPRLAAGGSGLGILLIIAAVIGAVVIILRETDHQLRIETRAGN